MRIPNIERMTEHVQSFDLGNMPHSYTDDGKLEILKAALIEVAKLEAAVKGMKNVLTAQKDELVEFIEMVKSYRQEGVLK